MYKVKMTVSCFILCMFILSLCAYGKEREDDSAVYEETIGGLEDNELFVIIDTNTPLPVLLVTSQVYDDGNATYTMEKENETTTLSEEEYYAAFEKYSNAAAAGFSYGVSDSAE